MLQLLLILFFTIIIEVLAVACNIAMCERRKHISALISAIMEPIKVVSLLFVIEGQYRYLSILIVSFACYVGNYYAVSMYDKLFPKKKKG